MHSMNGLIYLIMVQCTASKSFSFDKEVSFTNSQVKEKQNIWSEV